MDALKLARLARAKELQEEAQALIAPLIHQVSRLRAVHLVTRVVCFANSGLFEVYQELPKSIQEEVDRLTEKAQAIISAYQDQFAKEFDGQSERLRSSSKNQ